MIYLDNAATTFPKNECVYERMDQFMRYECVNAGRGGYRLAKKATGLIDETKQKLLNLAGAEGNREVVFTPSATIALNQIIFGLSWNKYKNVYVTPFEHNAIMRPLHKVASRYGVTIHTIPFDRETWELDQEQLKRVFMINNPDYIFMSHMSNVTGYILPCEQVIEIASQYKPIISIDCSQSMGIVPTDNIVHKADFLIFAGHKSLYGPLGVGGYIGNPDIELETVIVGGTGSDSLNLDMPQKGTSRYEAASFNMPAIAGLNESIKWITREQSDSICKRKKQLTNLLISKLKEIQQIKMYLPSNLDRHNSIVSFNILGWHPADVGLVLSEDFSIAVRTGYHCSPLVHDFIGTRETLGTVRISLGYFNTEEEIFSLVKAINELLEE